MFLKLKEFGGISFPSEESVLLLIIHVEPYLHFCLYTAILVKIFLDFHHHHHMALQPSSGPGLPLWGFVKKPFLQGWIVTPAPNHQPGLHIYDPWRQGGPAMPPGHWVPVLIAFYDMHGLQWDYSLIPATTWDFRSLIFFNLFQVKVQLVVKLVMDYIYFWYWIIIYIYIERERERERAFGTENQSYLTLTFKCVMQ
jgi:hypothetical protein